MKCRFKRAKANKSRIFFTILFIGFSILLSQPRFFTERSNEVRKEGDKFRVYTHDPASVLSGLWEYAKANDLKPISLSTLGPSLEDVFVKLTEIEVKTNKKEF